MNDKPSVTPSGPEWLRQQVVALRDVLTKTEGNDFRKRADEWERDLRQLKMAQGTADTFCDEANKLSAALEAETKRADAAELAHETDCGQLRAALSAAERRLQDYATVSDYAEELQTTRAALERARAALAKSRPWKAWGDWRVVCIYCGKLVDANSELGISDEHNPNCVWLAAALAEGGNK